MTQVLNLTKWIPTLSTTFLTLVGMFLGVTLLPTHITAIPTKGMQDNIPITHLNPIYLTPIEKNDDKEKLRAYHALCDKWGDLMDPTPSLERWAIHRILQCSSKVVKSGRRSIFYKVQFNNRNRA